MLYAIFCYTCEDVVGTWTRDETDKVMGRIGAVTDRLDRQARLGPAARLLPTTAATSLRTVRGQVEVVDGPFVETAEQLLGFYVVECASLDDAIDTARELLAARSGPGGYEIRPIATFERGGWG